MPTDCPCCAAREHSFWAQARDIEYATETGSYDYLRCHDCDCLYINPVPRERLQEIYPANYYAYSQDSASLIQRVKDWLDARLFKKLLARLRGSALAALDVGGGAGQQLSLLRRLDARITHSQVVDLDPQAQALAQSAGHDYFCGPIEQFSSEREYDLVLMLNIIEHVADPGAVLANVRDNLSAQGAILIKTPNTASLDARLFRRRNWVGYHCPRHWVLFNIGSFTRLCEQNGLRVQWHRYTQGAPFWAGSLVHLIAPGAGSKHGKYPRIIDHPLYGPLCALFAAFDIVRAPFSKPSQMFLLLTKK